MEIIKEYMRSCGVDDDMVRDGKVNIRIVDPTCVS